MDWMPWLTRWSEEWVRSIDQDMVDAELLRTRWLGFAPAAPEAVAAAEARLGTRLPPSYRSFLLATDGWREAGTSVRRLRDTSNVGWLHDIEPRWEKWELFSHDDERDAISRGLLISLQVDAGVLFLDPGDVGEDGEWAAYSLFSWDAEPPRRFPSFHALMENLYAGFRQMGEHGDDTDLARARLHALAGRTDTAIAALADADDPAASVLRLQLLLFLDRTDEARQLMARLLDDSTPDGFLNDPLFTEELLPLLFAEHERSASTGPSSILQAAMDEGDPEVLLAVDDHQTRLSQGDSQFQYGNPEFDALVKAALAQHNEDPEALWQAIADALASWQPRNTDHLAPVVLLADPVLAATFTPKRGRTLLSRPRAL
ncbi:SMI1/KNR4 family protein [Spirillospora sp. CA-294931]|uniref:SMI1/KNR4 family protein n=1 Tax=Spirillospora sp. CA-294931 TaxID=3240042 RepID=UPI003D8C1829